MSHNDIWKNQGVPVGCLKSNSNIMAHDIWKDDITLFLKGCRTCWLYKVLKFAFVADITKYELCQYSL